MLQTHRELSLWSLALAHSFDFWFVSLYGLTVYYVIKQ